MKCILMTSKIIIVLKFLWKTKTNLKKKSYKDLLEEENLLTQSSYKKAKTKYYNFADNIVVKYERDK